MVKTKTIDLPSCTTLTYLQALEKITSTINVIIEEVNRIEGSGIGDIAKIEQAIKDLKTQIEEIENELTSYDSRITTNTQDIEHIDQDIININANKQDKLTDGEDVEINNNIIDLTQETKTKILSIESKVNYNTMVEYVNTQIGNAIEEEY